MAADALKIILKAALDTSASAVGDLDKQISDLANKVTNLKLNVQVDNAKFNELTQSIKRIQELTGKGIRIFDKDTFSGTAFKTIEDAIKKYGELGQVKVSQSFDASTKALQGFNLEVTKADGVVEKLKFNIAKLSDGTNIEQIFKLDSLSRIDKSQELLEKQLQAKQQTEARITKIEEDAIQKRIQYEKEYENWWLKSLKSQEVAEEASNKKRLDSLQLFQERSATIEQNLIRRYGKGIDSSALSSLSDEIKSLTLETPDLDKKMRQLSNGFKDIEANAKNSGSHISSFGENLKTAFSKFPIWVLTATAFYAPLRAIESGISYIHQLDTAMTDLQKTTDATQEQYAQFAKEAAKTANSIGSLTLDVIKSTTEWSRLGYTLHQSAQLAKETTIYQNVGDIANAEAASTDLIAAIKGFGIQVDDQGKNITHLVDVYNEVGNKFAISSAGIGEAAKRSASALSEAGNSMEQSVALITAANSAVQDPEKVGNGLKTISLRLQGISEDGTDVSTLVPTLEKKFNSLGISLKNNDDTFKSTYEIFQELYNVWGKLSDFQKSDILQLVAGKENANTAASLISNFADAQGALEAGLNSVGSAARENQKYLDSLQGHVARFQNTVTSFWSNSVNSDFLKGIVDIGTGIVKVFGNMERTVVILSGAFIAFKSKAIVDFISGIGSSIKTLFTFNSTLATTSVVAEETSVAVSTLSASMRVFQASLGIIGLVVSAGTLLYGVLSQVNDATDKASDTIDKNNQKYGDLISNLSDVSSYYKENYKNIQKDADVKNQLFTMQNKLIDTFGNEADGLDLVNGKYDDQIKKIDELNRKTLENKVKKNQISVDAINAELYGTPLVNAKANPLKTYFNAGNNDYKVLNVSAFGNMNIQQYYEKLNVILNAITNKDKDMAKAALYFDKLPSNAQEWSNALNAVQNQLNAIQPKINQINKQESDKKELIKENTLAQVEFNQTQKDMFDKINSSMSDLPTSDYEKSITGVVNAVKSFNGSNLDQVLTSIKGISSVTPDIYNAIASAIKETDKAQSNALSTTLDLTSAQEKLKSAFKDSSDAITPLNQALADVSNGQALTADSVADLITKYPELASSLVKTADGWTIEASAIEARRKAAIQNQEDSLKAEAGITDAVLSQLKDRLKAYGIELETIQTLADARLAAADKLTPKGLPEDRGNYKQAKDDLLAYGSIIEQINALDKLMNDRSLGVTKTKSSSTKSPSSKSQDQLKDALQEQDLTKELINSFNAEYEARKKNIDAIDRKIKLAEQQGNEVKQADLTTKKIEEQTKAIDALKTAQQKMSQEADKIRSQRPDLNTNSWFDVNGEASQAYKEFINSFAKRSEVIRNNTKLSVKDRNSEIDALKKEQDEVQTMFDHLYQLKSAWKDNTTEVQNLGDAITQDQEKLKQVVENAAQAVIDAQNAIDQAVIDSYQEQIDTLQKQWEAQAITEERAKRQSEIADLNNKLAIIQAGNLGNISDELAKQLGLEQAKADYLQKQNDLIVEQQKLQNIQNEKNVRLFQNGHFEWVADPRQVKEQQDKISSMQDDFNKWQKDQLESVQDDLKSKVEDYNNWEIQQTRNNLIAQLQAKIDAKQKEIEQRNKDFDEEKKAWEQHGIDMNGVLSTTMDNLNQTYGKKWDDILSILRSKLSDAQSLYAQIISMATVSIPTSSGGATGFAVSSGSSDVNSQLAQMAQNSRSWYTAGDSEKKQLSQQNQQIAENLRSQGLDPKYDAKTGKWNILKYHTGLQEGLVGDGTSISSILSKLGVKQGEQLTRLLNGEAIIKNPVTMIENIVGSFKGIADILSFTPKVAAASAGDTNYYITVDKVQTNDAKSFIQNLKLYAKNN